MCVVYVKAYVVLILIVSIQIDIYIIVMIEAIAIVELVASIVLLVDLNAKVVSRLHDFTSKFLKVLKSFRSLSTRLSLLTTTLQHI